MAEAEEFHEVRFRSGEKPLYKQLNSANGIKFPIKTDLALAAHKRSIIIQTELGGVDLPTDSCYGKHLSQFRQDKSAIFGNINRLIRCIVDCQIHLQDGPATRHALELGRSVGARVWDNSPLQMKQIQSIGPVAVRKLVAEGVNSIDTLEATDPIRLNVILSRTHGTGDKLLESVKHFPKLRVMIRLLSQVCK